MVLLQRSKRICAMAIGLCSLVVHGCAGLQEALPSLPSEGPTNQSRVAAGAGSGTLSDDEIRRLLLIDADSFHDRRAVAPSSGFLTPSAYGADSREAYIGIAGVTAGNNTDLDGSSSFGIGFGDATESIGVEINAAIISLRDEFAEDGSIGVKVHRYFPDAGKVAVALGWSNPIAWGAAENAADTFYGVLTRRFDLNTERRMPLTASLGIGTGSFRSQSAIDDGDNTPNLFGSVSMRVRQQVSVIGSWTGRSLGVAASAAPFSLPLVLTVGFSDITDLTPDGTRFQGTLGYSLNF